MPLSNNEHLAALRRKYPQKQCACGALALPVYAGKCIDCYFDALSAEIARRPIGHGRPHGGAVSGE